MKNFLQGDAKKMNLRSILAAMTLALLVASVPLTVVGAGGPPPADYPQVCSPSYCVQVLATYPDIPGRITVDAKAFKGDATLTMDLGNRFSVAFHSKYVDGRLQHRPSEARWRRDGSTATAWACLACGAVRGKDAIIGVALTGIPAGYDADLSGLSVCFWPLNMSVAGQGDGTTMQLGERVCVKGANWRRPLPK